MPKVNIYLTDDLAAAVREAKIPVSAVCQAALERAVRDMTAARSVDDPPPSDALTTLGLYGRFTPRARTAVTNAQSAARDASHPEVGTEHVLLGILDVPGNLALAVLADLDIELDDLRSELLASMPVGESPGDPAGHVPFSGRAKQALEQTTKEAIGLGHNYIGCEHLLLGLLATEDGLGAKVLRRMGVELRTTRRAVVAALTTLAVETSKPKPPTPPPAAPAPESSPDPTLQAILTRLEAIERRLPDP